MLAVSFNPHTRARIIVSTNITCYETVSLKWPFHLKLLDQKSDWTGNSEIHDLCLYSLHELIFKIVYCISNSTVLELKLGKLSWHGSPKSSMYSFYLYWNAICCVYWHLPCSVIFMTFHILLTRLFSIIFLANLISQAYLSPKLIHLLIIFLVHFELLLVIFLYFSHFHTNQSHAYKFSESDTLHYSLDDNI